MEFYCGDAETVAVALQAAAGASTS